MPDPTLNDPALIEPNPESGSWFRGDPLDVSGDWFEPQPSSGSWFRMNPTTVQTPGGVYFDGFYIGNGVAV